MNEKVKKALRIAGIVGICALLFACGCGLGYCSAQKTGEPTKVLTERHKKEEKTETESGYSRYSFTINENFPTEAGYYNYTIYSVDTSTYTLTESQSGTTEAGTSWGALRTQTNDLIQSSVPSQATTLNFLAYWGYVYFWGTNSTPRYTAYFSFLKSQNNVNIQNLPFVSPTAWTHANGYDLSSAGSYRQWENANRFYLTLDRSNMYILDNVSTSKPISSLEFIDVISYYGDQGYNRGYENGYDDGEIDGYGSGFEAGSGTGKMFTYLGVNPMRWYKTNLTATDQTDTSVTYRLLTFKDGENQTWSIYATNYIASLETNNLSIDLFKGSTASSANRRLTLGNGTETSLGSGIWDVEPKDYATFAFAQIIEVYNNSLVENYFLLDGIPANATGYEMGYQKGWSDGYNATPGGQSLDNVFSIFTKAFEATASFFNMKVFGFLPIYWFFLIPIFVAIITLLMRMIKH